MKFASCFSAVFTVAILSVILQGSSSNEDIWSYNAEPHHFPPEKWAKLSGNEKCVVNGPRQSPIDIPVSSITAPGASNLDESLDFNSYTSDECPLDYHHFTEFPADTVMSNKFDATEDCKASFTIKKGRNAVTCKLDSIHMHFNSEHTFDGKHQDGELHLVHACDDKTFAVIGMLMEKVAGRAANDFGKEYIENSLAQHQLASLPFKSLFGNGPFAGTYFNYMGGLTTPNCAETVTWLVTKDTLKVPKDTFETLRKKALKGFTAATTRARIVRGNAENNRNTQALGTRELVKGRLLYSEIFPN